MARSATPQCTHLILAFRESSGDGSINTILYFVPQPGHVNGIGSSALMAPLFPREPSTRLPASPPRSEINVSPARPLDVQSHGVVKAVASALHPAANERRPGQTAFV